MLDWISEAMEANATFLARIDADRLMRERPSGRVVITCMDSRINLEAIGIPSFDVDGHNASRVAIIRTAGARCPEPSLFIALFKAGVTEVLVVGHTDCAAVAAHTEITPVLDEMRASVDPADAAAFFDAIGASRDDDVKGWLGTIPGPAEGVLRQIAAIRSLPFVPDGLVVDGLVYDVDTGEVHPVEDPAQ